MNKLCLSVGIILVIVLLIRCDEDENVGSRSWPRLTTLEVTKISWGGAQFNARIIYRGDAEILRYGFVWSDRENPVLENCDRKVVSYSPPNNMFSELITTTLDDAVAYYIRAFVETKDFTVYGNKVRFLSMGSGAPTIFSFRPVSGRSGDTVFIRGKNFSYVPNTNTVFFEAYPKYVKDYARVIFASDTLLVVKVPSIELYESHENVQINVQIFHWLAKSIDRFTVIR